MKRKLFNSLMSAVMAASLCIEGASPLAVAAESWSELPEIADESYIEDDYAADEYYEDDYVADEEYYEDDTEALYEDGSDEAYYDETTDEMADYNDETEYLSDDEPDDVSYIDEVGGDNYQEDASADTEESSTEDNIEESVSVSEETQTISEGTVTLVTGEDGYFYMPDENNKIVPDPEGEKTYTGLTGTAIDAEVKINSKSVRKEFKGWSTGEEGAEILSLAEFTYPEDSLTLFAVYADREQFEDRDVIPMENTEVFDGTNTLDIGPDQIAILTFTPKENGNYIFSTVEDDNAGTAGYLYENGICCAKDESPEDGSHFEIKYELKADTVYEIGVAYLTEDISGTIEFNIKKEGTELSEESLSEAEVESESETVSEADQLSAVSLSETEIEPELMTVSEESSDASEDIGTLLKIVKEPENAAVEAEGDKATVTVEAEGDDLSYQWYYMNPGAGKFLASSNKSAEYSASVTERINGRQVYCVITDSHGNSVTSKTVSISIKKLLEIITQPVDAVVGEVGEKATVTVEAEGSGLTYQWHYKNSDVKNFLVSSVKTPEYTVAVTNKVDGRQVYCVITDASGNSVTTNTVTISVGRPLKIIRQPADGVVSAIGEMAAVSVEAEGNGLSYQWFYQNADSSKFLASSKKTAEYTVTVTEKVNGRKVYCEITDANGEKITTDTVSIYVKEAIEIIRQPETVYADELGEKVTLSVEAEGTGLTYQWYYKNKDVSKFLASSTKTDTYQTTLTAKTDGRQVYCEITDAEGNKVTSEIAEMWLYTPMAITKQPTDIEVTALGEKAEVSFEAEGTGLTYQWYYKNKGVKKFLASSSKKAVYSVAVTEKVNGRQVYCEITDVKGNVLQTDTISLMIVDEINIEDVIYKTVAGVMTVTDYVGTATNVTVQETAGGKTVTAVGEGAFEGKDFLESVDLPDTIEVIGERAFKGCTGLRTMK